MLGPLFPGTLAADHPAKFSDELFPIMARMLGDSSPDEKLLDPYAGTCKIRLLRDPEITEGKPFLGKIYCQDLEEPWAIHGLRLVDGLICCDSRRMPWKDESFDYVGTSPCYANRCSDSHTPSEDDTSFRITYTHFMLRCMGRKLRNGNAGAMPWGKKYRELHELVWRECWRILKKKEKRKKAAKLLLNMKGHYKTIKVKGVKVREYRDVTKWHVECLQDIGFHVVDWEKVPVKGMKYGENRDVRDGYESLVLLEKPV